jgi:hypothetical protein
MAHQITGMNTEEAGVEKLDEALSQRTQSAANIEEIVEEFQEVMDKACKLTFRQSRPNTIDNKSEHHKSVPWWTQNLTILREKVNAHRRRYQRTTGCTALREQRKVQYTTIKAEYAKTINKEKYESWK